MIIKKSTFFLLYNENKEYPCFGILQYRNAFIAINNKHPWYNNQNIKNNISFNNNISFIGPYDKIKNHIKTNEIINLKSFWFIGWNYLHYNSLMDVLSGRSNDIYINNDYMINEIENMMEIATKYYIKIEI